MKSFKQFIQQQKHIRYNYDEFTLLRVYGATVKKISTLNETTAIKRKMKREKVNRKK